MVNITTNVHSQVIETSIHGYNITVQCGVLLSSAGTYLNANTPFRFDGIAGDTYIKYNSTTGLLEFWVDGVKKQELWK